MDSNSMKDELPPITISLNRLLALTIECRLPLRFDPAGVRTKPWTVFTA
ncbi:hypothetical protein [Roseinatronobacter alkalisoli]|uniref:Uncharacterized protein n=1 Tax=Roseinatronobacter alkalisoli TaxID=3028235 RepID=A0ABT5TGC8_9RHOB|nr:hypothetical protein [Roseinatronobacter sp. HJB301]MDD7973745.1 hypothetical protein [Roseinatronobacter sp. HJB301]